MLPGVRGRDLMKDYLSAKGSEPYAGVDALGYGQIVTFTLQNLVGRTQPLLFDSPGIEDERWPRGDNGYAAAPAPSPIWERGYEAFKRGEQLALPYVEPRVGDETKQAQLTAAYKAYAAGETDILPDLADIFPDDPMTRARIGLQTEPGATPAEALIQACGSCHNDVLDQTISRARFNVQLSRLDHAELDVAIDRIERPRAAIGAMPPPEARQLDPDARAQLVEFLRHEARDGVDDPQLEHAATVGMSGGGGSER
jgi:mono/diheme cytochrome c family protein